MFKNKEPPMGDKENIVKANPPPPFPQKFKKKKEEECFAKFIELLKQVHINLPLIDVLQGIPKYAKYVKDVVANKSWLAEYETVALTEECSSRILDRSNLPQKLKDSGSFTIEVAMGHYLKAKGLCDLDASINLMPSSIFQKLGLGAPKPTTILLQLADHSVARPNGIVEDVLVQVGFLILSVDFVVLDFEPDPAVPLILGRPFLATGGALIDVAAGRLTMRAHDKIETFDVYPALPQSSLHEEVLAIATRDARERPDHHATDNDVGSYIANKWKFMKSSMQKIQRKCGGVRTTLDTG